jgi:hypothetical protein
MKLLLGGIAALLLLASLHDIGAGQEPPASPAVPRAAIAAIVDAYREYRIVGLGDAHGNQLGEAFQLALIRDPGFRAVVNDIIVESGNFRYQDLADRFVRGENVPPEALQRIWVDTTQQQVASLDVPELFMTVRALNASAPAEGRLRILLGEPPIEWERLKTADDYKTWEAQPTSDRDWFGAELVRREVLAKNRRALALYGAGHFFRKVVNQSLVTILEGSQTKVFTIWTNAALELASVQADVRTWSAPSLALIRGTTLGRTGLAAYLGPKAGELPPQWLAPMEDQFDAVLYLGPLSTIKLARPQPWRCEEPALSERVRRANLQRPGLGDRVKAQCVSG